MVIRRDAHLEPSVRPAAHDGSEGAWEQFVGRMLLAGFAVVLALEGWLLWRAWHMWIAP